MTRIERQRSQSEDVMVVDLVDTRLALAPSVRDALERLHGCGRRSPVVYMGRVLSHPCNLLMLFGVLLLSFIGWSLPVLLVGIALEAGLLSLSPWVRFLRRRIDVQLDETDRAEAARAHDALVQQMDGRHQQELARLERLIDRTRENLSRRLGGAQLSLSSDADLTRLTASYIRLAIAYRAGQESLAMTSYQDLTDTIQTLETVRRASGTRMRELAERRLAIAYRRVECWSRTREGLEAISQQLATIVELVQLMHEQSLTPMDPHSACVEIDRFMRDLEHREGAMREIDALSNEEDLDLGEFTPEPASAPMARARHHHATAP
jgi:signal transduction histidine kinase